MINLGNLNIKKLNDVSQHNHVEYFKSIKDNFDKNNIRYVLQSFKVTWTSKIEWSNSFFGEGMLYDKY